MDAVVGTFVCSVPNLVQEVLRVLKPGGRFIYRTRRRPKELVLLRQSGVKPIWKAIATLSVKLGCFRKCWF